MRFIDFLRDFIHYGMLIWRRRKRRGFQDHRHGRQLRLNHSGSDAHAFPGAGARRGQLRLNCGGADDRHRPRRYGDLGSFDCSRI